MKKIINILKRKIRDFIQKRKSRNHDPYIYR